MICEICRESIAARDLLLRLKSHHNPLECMVRYVKSEYVKVYGSVPLNWSEADEEMIKIFAQVLLDRAIKFNEQPKIFTQEEEEDVRTWNARIKALRF